MATPSFFFPPLRPETPSSNNACLSSYGETPSFTSSGSHLGKYKFPRKTSSMGIITSLYGESLSTLNSGSNIRQTAPLLPSAKIEVLPCIPTKTREGSRDLISAAQHGDDAVKKDEKDPKASSKETLRNEKQDSRSENLVKISSKKKITDFFRTNSEQKLEKLKQECNSIQNRLEDINDNKKVHLNSSEELKLKKTELKKLRQIKSIAKKKLIKHIPKDQQEGLLESDLEYQLIKIEYKSKKDEIRRITS